MSDDIEPVSDEIELISDGDGLAVFGETSAVERFMSTITTLDQTRALSIGAATASTAGSVAAQSGRWVKLTADSAAKVKKHGLMTTGTKGVRHAMIGKPGKIESWIQIDKSAAANLTNPARLANASAIMTQMAMQQQLDAIADYLEVIDQKIDSVLRTQVNQVLARLDGVDQTIREGFTVKDAVGRVSEVTWSKLQASTQTIHEVQGFAIRQLGELAERIEAKKIHELLELVDNAETEVKKWLLVLARCFELHEQVGILELDRVLDAAPDELDQHRLGLQSARANRVLVIREATESVLRRIGQAIEAANSRVLFNPIQSPAVVETSERITAEVIELRRTLSIDEIHESVAARRWREAAGETISTAGVAGSSGLESARRSGGAAVGTAKDLTGKLAGRIAERRKRTDTSDEPPSGPDASTV